MSKQKIACLFVLVCYSTTLGFVVVYWYQGTPLNNLLTGAVVLQALPKVSRLLYEILKD